MDTEGRDAVVDLLRRKGAHFAFVHGSRAGGEERVGSDLDVAAWWGADAPAPWDVGVADGTDLLILDSAPLELAGRVALHGVLLFDDDPPARVEWQARTRKIYLDEEDRQRRLDQLFLTSRGHG
ncbi:MAG: nucleotidyltransferase domain-containing protein [Actinomycetota bacterium]|nr:nucleotidyltransferase domain-containing protein [Actinomycetota bacterium]